MATLKDYSVGAVVGAVLPAIVTLNIFATKADIAELKADIAMNYVSKAEIQPQIDEMKSDIRKILIKLGKD